MFPDLNADPGRGNLSARAYVASLVGPRRIVHGRKAVKQLNNEGTSPLLANPADVEVMYYEIWLPQSSIMPLPGNGAFIGVSDNETSGQNAFQILLSATQRFSGILLPDDQLYGQVFQDALGGAVANLSVVVASVVF